MKTVKKNLMSLLDLAVMAVICRMAMWGFPSQTTIAIMKNTRMAAVLTKTSPAQTAPLPSLTETPIKLASTMPHRQPPMKVVLQKIKQWYLLPTKLKKLTKPIMLPTGMKLRHLMKHCHLLLSHPLVCKQILLGVSFTVKIIPLAINAMRSHYSQRLGTCANVSSNILSPLVMSPMRMETL